MGIAKAHPAVSVEDYLAGEQNSDARHEYINGETYVKVGARVSHNRISNNFSALLTQHLKGKRCESFVNDLKVRVDQAFFYPDVIVDCSGLKDDALYTESPTLIVEVLSSSTRKMDSTIKRDAYLSLTSLQEYIMIEQDFVDVEVLRRADNWQSRHYFMGDEIYLGSVDFYMPVEEVYDRVENEDVQKWLMQKAAEL